MNNDGRPPTTPSAPGELLRPGAFMRVTQLSRKALRLYDELGLLSPAHIDQDTGYRSYAPEQIARARFIRLLREAEMPLATIGRVLDAPTAAEAEQLVAAYRQQHEERGERVRRTTRRIMSILRQEEQTMSFTIEVQQIPARQVVSIQKRLTIDEMQPFIQESIAALKGLIAEQGLRITDEVMGLYYGPVNENDDGPLEIAFPVEGVARPRGPIAVREIPAHTAAVTSAGAEFYQFPAVLQVWDAITDWVRANGYLEPEAPVTCYEVWHEDCIEIRWPIVRE